MSSKSKQNRAQKKAAKRRDPSPEQDPDPTLTTLLEIQRRLLNPTTPEQTLLNIITTTLASTFSLPDFPTRLQQIKSLFYDRKYTEIFTNPDLLPVYAAEYIPGRALCYRDLFLRCAVLREAVAKEGAYVYCLGSGNGSELVGIANAVVGMWDGAIGEGKVAGGGVENGYEDGMDNTIVRGLEGRDWGGEVLRWERELLKERVDDVRRLVERGIGGEKGEVMEQLLKERVDALGICQITTHLPSTHITTASPHLTLHCQDLSSYDPILPSLHKTLTTTLPLPPNSLHLLQSTHNLLTPTPTTTPLHTQSIKSSTIITALFLLNELLATSKPAFTRFIATLIQHMTPGTLFLVADSAGSFSEVQVGEGNYMVYHLLDRIGALECLVKEDSVWYRFPDGLTYPCKLNNMRYFLRVYRKR
ncbi:hypothetical protein HDV00_009643 [Rhizophlyctis rosea]|nr:hypothetical protein HDV00_009643 [Rhizophlyctis rosea]